MAHRAVAIDDRQQGLPISQALISGDLVLVAGQVCPEGGDVPAQTRCILERIGMILRASGSDYDHVMRCGVYLRRGEDFGDMNKVYRGFFKEPFPARTSIVCELLEPRMLIEIDCVARIPDLGRTTGA